MVPRTGAGSAGYRDLRGTDGFRSILNPGDPMDQSPDSFEISLCSDHSLISWDQVKVLTSFPIIHDLTEMFSYPEVQDRLKPWLANLGIELDSAKRKVANRCRHLEGIIPVGEKNLGKRRRTVLVLEAWRLPMSARWNANTELWDLEPGWQWYIAVVEGAGSGFYEAVCRTRNLLVTKKLEVNQLANVTISKTKTTDGTDELQFEMDMNRCRFTPVNDPMPLHHQLPKSSLKLVTSDRELLPNLLLEGELVDLQTLMRKRLSDINPTRLSPSYGIRLMPAEIALLALVRWKAKRRIREKRHCIMSSSGPHRDTKSRTSGTKAKVDVPIC